MTSQDKRANLWERARATAMALPSAVWLVFGVVAWELATPAPMSILGGVGDALGQMDASEHRAKQSAMADYEHDLATAVGEVERISGAYQAMYQAYGQVVGQAYQMESGVLSRQMQTMRETQHLDVIGSNVASAACQAGQLLGDPQLATACDAESRMRENLMRDYADMGEYRTDIPDRMMRAFPHPDTLVSEDMQRVRARVRGNGDAR